MCMWDCWQEGLSLASRWEAAIPGPVGSAVMSMGEVGLCFVSEPEDLLMGGVDDQLTRIQTLG